MIGMMMLAAAAADPAYLTCSFPSSGGAFVVDFSLDEARARATITIPASNRIVGRDAAFSPTEVKIPDQESLWSINRSDLTISRAMDFGPQPNVDRGTCKLAAEPAKRAF